MTIESDVALCNHGYPQRAPLLRRGGRQPHLPDDARPSTRNFGRNRKSDNPRDGVVNRWVKVTTSPARSSPTGARSRRSGRELDVTIVALAIRQAEHIAAQTS
jgi:hypothetical protein